MAIGGFNFTQKGLKLAYWDEYTCHKCHSRESGNPDKKYKNWIPDPGRG